MQKSLSTLIVVAISVLIFGCSVRRSQIKPIKKPVVIDSRRNQIKPTEKSIFVGKWCNKDFKTRGITRVHIRQVGSNLIVHMWGRCHPNECDWGEVVSTLNKKGEPLVVNWRNSFSVRAQELRIMPDGSLEVTSKTKYTDNSRRRARTNTYYYVKGLVHDWSD